MSDPPPPAAGRLAGVRLGRHARPSARPDRRLRPLRLLPADLPHLRALGRGDGLAARAHRAHEAGARRDLRAADRAPRQLPRLHGLRHGLPVGGAVRQAARGRPRAGRAQLRAAGGGPPAPPAHLRAVHPAGRLRVLAPGAALAHRLGIPKLARTPLAKRLAPRLAAMTAMTPQASVRRALERLPTRFEAHGEKRGEVALLQGCVQRVFFGHVNRDTARVLAAEGFEVHVPPAAALLRRAAPARRRGPGGARARQGDHRGARGL